jgi:HD-GYP domain-containing protein (c-di-GMP phosphodiesterase class II)
MTTDRPYRKALGVAEARAEFARFRGRQFDPSICDKILTDAAWEEIYQSYQDQAPQSPAVAALSTKAS